jgi:hypothetical protein
MDTQILEAYEPLDVERKRKGEQASGSKKKERAHIKSLETSLKTNDVEIIATTVED